MRNLIFFLAFITLPFSGYSQKKNKNKLPSPPPAENLLVLSTDTLSLQEGAMPILFEWEMNADTTLKPSTVFKELIRLKYNATEVNGTYSLEPLTLKKAKGNRKSVVPEIPKKITAINYYDAAIANGILTLTERGRIVMRLKIGYDKNKQISYLKDLKGKKIYKHIESDEPVLAVPVQ